MLDSLIELAVVEIEASGEGMCSIHIEVELRRHIPAPELGDPLRDVLVYMSIELGQGTTLIGDTGAILGDLGIR